ncbi:D-glycero-beta-D-manno-heptose 1-phosphate adenylyltransferase [Helicobacter sp. 11S02629-2]|uniref:D-glycero-beta-D-manno-heptose 1-phosphate adenylyltransferase n=1 Tax=Helicobacter sp. 11S02629-2 TaxID=1476195 RepID=UPI000BA6FE7A|nr:D-glycero-beta-D-manno-heptose 1-phosphate adenylyltransferase [Helicobacter sp. 11S02629-2]PAF45419.1 bifunctional heptose 7-phosphate kinase/heptose 1-phosphate adenyltransferase [Helicobacter sp. 11S02629-2]
MQTKSILVIGDLMLDSYIFGSVDKISPEAPVPVLLAKDKSFSLGGACNVANNLVALKTKVKICGVIGHDENGKKLLDILESKGINTDLVFKDERPTTLKCRIVAKTHQMLRFDEEKILPISKELEDKILDALKLEKVDCVILSDYAKGVLSKSFAQAIISFCNAHNILIVCDPKGKDFTKYLGATLITPNIKEASFATDIDIKDDESLKKALNYMKDVCKLKYPLITLSEDGIGYMKDGIFAKSRAKAQEVYDVSGAGDSAIAAIAFKLIEDREDIKQACDFANIAAAIVVGKFGSAVASLEEIENALSRSIVSHKILDINSLKYRILGKKIVFTNGCFDILHVGHASYLQKAKTLGDVLVVGLNSDASVKRLKGKARPINSEYDRAYLLASLSCVDFVVVFDEDTPLKLIEALHPDVLVKGADYEGKEVVGSNIAKEVVLLEFIKDKSTTNIINKIKG